MPKQAFLAELASGFECEEEKHDKPLCRGSKESGALTIFFHSCDAWTGIMASMRSSVTASEKYRRGELAYFCVMSIYLFLTRCVKIYPIYFNQ
jgi:hypothetical protein